MTAVVTPAPDASGPIPANQPEPSGAGAVSRYDVLGVVVELVSDDPAIVEVIEASYGIFRTDTEPGPDRPVAARLRVERTGSTWRVAGGTGEPRTCPSADIAAIHTLDRLVDTVQRGLHASGLIAIHAAAVATPGGIVIVAGASGQGKSTLALGLAHRGLGLLSDELAIVDEAGVVKPYPRSVHVRPDTIELIPALGFLRDRVRLTLGGGSEWALTPAELRDRWGGTPARPAPLAAVILLDGVPGAGDASIAPVSPAIAALELTRSSWAASVAFGDTLSRLATIASSVPCVRLRSATLDRTLDVVSGWLGGLGLTARVGSMIKSQPAMQPRDLARIAMLETWRRDRTEAWIEATGGSMLPLIRPGDRLSVAFGAQDPRPGDVIVFRHGDLIVAHRVVGRRLRDGMPVLIAKGDNEPFATEDVAPSDLLGVVRTVDGGSRGPSARGFGGLGGIVTARVSRVGGSLTRASARRTSPITKLPTAGAALAARSALFLWTSCLASSRRVESTTEGGDQS